MKITAFKKQRIFHVCGAETIRLIIIICDSDESIIEIIVY